MPIYKYACRSCGELHEQLQMRRAGELEPPDPCPACGSTELEQRMHQTAPPKFEAGLGWAGWDMTGPNTVGRTVDLDKSMSGADLKRHREERKQAADAAKTKKAV